MSKYPCTANADRSLLIPTIQGKGSEGQLGKADPTCPSLVLEAHLEASVTVLLCFL